ncbi:MAG: hypothetical protein HY023_16750 [Chloroflexi bacterium]|nr:hypothetical protein [Chloroflexota bacterium]MBI3763740.1 hypothetical protein [Chloroflexota bacterium]
MEPLHLAIPVGRYHQPQGHSNDCAPFAVAIVVNALTGSQIDGAILAEVMNQPRRWLGPLPIPVIRRIPNWATFPWGITDQLQRHDIAARWRFGADEEDLFAALKENRIAMPIVGSLWPLWAHVKILAAHDPERGWGFVDPARSDGSLSWESERQFGSSWANYAHLLVETL